MKFKRYCKTLLLENDPQLIEAYKEVHAKGNTWPEIGQGMKEVGILDMEIYLHENRLFMIMDTVPGFDHDKAMVELAAKPRQAEWEAFVSRFQVTSESATADEKWQLMERIYELDQQEEYKAEEGQQKEIRDESKSIGIN
ncbi:L-rhamnose mutarotase [Mangrovibacterium lignilyticum]|uniref:L-rhamnose mutarotase n=1 Tax=Mangrovibacterium lignilyticum TaxID=2668052 RepID=UPI0013D8C626|nr:L-rhamnose mutarotase [Mangrovibacterium lignilyticum]